jgi:beta-lactamase class A
MAIPCFMPRRSLLPVIVWILCCAHAPILAAGLSPARSELESQVAQIAGRHHGQVAVFAEALSTGQTVSLRSDEPVATASVIKLAILYEAMRQIRQGLVHWSDPVTVSANDQTAGSGVLGYFDAPATLSLKDVLFMMTALSDNTATNIAIDRLGLQAVNDEVGRLGLKSTWLYKKIGKPAIEPMPADQKRFGLGKTTAAEMATLMRRIVTCRLGEGDAPPTESDLAICAISLHMLRSQFYRDGVPRYLEAADSSEEGSAIANKTGALNAVRNDVAAIATKNGLVIVSIFTWDNADRSWTDDTEAYLTMARIAKAIVNAWSPNGLDAQAFRLMPSGTDLPPSRIRN